MSNIDNFAKAFKKSLYKAGDKLELYGNTYTVTSCDNKYTLLMDSKGTPCAYPTKIVKKLVVDGNFKKSIQKSEKVDKLHGGKIRVDKVDHKGRKYHYWVDATHGVKHEAHDSEPHKNQLDEQSVKLHSKMNSIINQHAHPQDAEKLKGMLNEFVQAKAAHRHLTDAHNQLAREQKGIHESTIHNIASKQDIADKKLNQLKDALKQSKMKKLKGENNE